MAVHEARVEEVGESMLVTAAHFSAGGSVVKVAYPKCESWTWVSHQESSRPWSAAVQQCTCWTSKYSLSPHHPSVYIDVYGPVGDGIYGNEDEFEAWTTGSTSAFTYHFAQSLRGSEVRRSCGQRGAANNSSFSAWQFAWMK